MCYMGVGSVLTLICVAVLAIIISYLQQPLVVPFAQQTEPGGNTQQGSWYGNSALHKLKEGLHSVRVSKVDATAVQRQLEGELFGKWDEQFTAMETRGIQIKALPKYLDHLQAAYEGIDAKMRKKMDGILYSTGWNHKIFEFNIKQNESSGTHYGMLAFGRSADGKTVDCMYVLYEINFDIAAEENHITEDHSVLWGLINWQTTRLENKERRIGLKTLNKLRNFLHYKALNAFYKEGYIDSINYVEDTSTETDDITG